MRGQSGFNIVLKTTSCLIFSAILVIIPMARAVADQIPPHLAGMAATLFRSSEAELKAANPNDARGWASLRAYSALRELGMERWRPEPPPQWRGRDQLVTFLDLTSASTDQDKILNQFLSRAWADGMESAILALFADMEREIPEPEALGVLVSNLDGIFNTGYDDLERAHLIESVNGPDVTLNWEPQQGSFRIRVRDDGSEFKAPYQSSLVGDIQPVLTGDSDSPMAFKLTPAPDPIQTFDAQDLLGIRDSIFGEWFDGSGSLWLITPLNAETKTSTKERPKKNRRAEILARISQIQTTLDELQGSTVYVWKNAQSGEREEQTRFRRKKDPWEYMGVQSTGVSDAQDVATLEGELSALKAELDERPQVPPGPVLPQPTSDGRVQSIQLSYVRSSGSLVVMDDARLSGNTVSASRILRSIDDITDLPEMVISQLISEWSPPEWVDLDATILNNGQLELTGSLWRLHVTYDRDDNTVSSIQTPYAIPVKLTRDNRRKAP